MLVVLLIVIVLMGVAYADMCLVSNTAHFGICYGKVAEDAESRAGKVIAAAEDVEEVAEVVGQGLDSTVVDIATSIKDDLLDAL